jgi:hypothetical protein
MSSADSLLERIRATYAHIAETEAVAVAHPGDRYVLASLSAVKEQAVQLEAEWLELSHEKQQEVCRYRLMSSAGEAYSASGFAKSLIEFQELFSQIYDAIKNGVKSRARVSGQVSSDSSFKLAYTFPGSLGVVLTVQDDLSLFENKFGTAIDAFNDVMAVSTEFEVRDMAKTLGEAVVRKVFDWSQANVNAGYGVDVTWKMVDGTYKGQIVDRDSLERLSQIISRTSDIERRTLNLSGSLVAIDIPRKRFRLVVPDGDDFPGVLSEGFDVSRKWAVNTSYRAKIEMETITHYATQKTDRTYKLKSLQTEPYA